jgi:hypothetical protein
MMEVMEAGPCRTGHMQNPKPESSALTMILACVSWMCRQQQACQGAVVLHEDLCQLCGSLIAINQEEVMAAGPRRTGHMQSPKPESSALTKIRFRFHTIDNRNEWQSTRPSAPRRLANVLAYNIP